MQRSCVAAVSGRECGPRVDVSCQVIKSGFVGLEMCALGVVEVDVIVRWAEGDNDKSRSEAIASLVYYYHGGFGIFFCSNVCVLVL